MENKSKGIKNENEKLTKKEFTKCLIEGGAEAIKAFKDADPTLYLGMTLVLTQIMAKTDKRIDELLSKKGN